MKYCHRRRRFIWRVLRCFQWNGCGLRTSRSVWSARSLLPLCNALARWGGGETCKPLTRSKAAASCAHSIRWRDIRAVSSSRSAEFLRAKVALAKRLRQETTMSLKWIAQRLQMGSWTYVANLLNAKASRPNLCK